MIAGFRSGADTARILSRGLSLGRIGAARRGDARCLIARRAAEYYPRVQHAGGPMGVFTNSDLPPMNRRYLMTKQMSIILAAALLFALPTLAIAGDSPADQAQMGQTQPPAAQTQPPAAQTQ